MARWGGGHDTAAKRILSPRRDVFLWKSKAEVGRGPGTLFFSFLFEQWKWASEASKELSPRCSQIG